jgi:nucleotide-binding universal stress UspA family protein
MYSTFVVGTDGSTTASEAVRHASELARAMGATLHVVHAFQAVSALATLGPDAGAAAASAGLAEAVETQARQILERAGAAARAEGVTVETHLCAGDPASALIDTADRLSADLIVIGNKGMSGVRRFVLGSVPNKISHHCPCSLLIVNTAH